MTSGLAIGALAERTGVAPSALRFYEAEGLIHADRTDGGQRRYHRDAIRRVSFVRVRLYVTLSSASRGVRSKVLSVIMGYRPG